jgi:NADH-quinone oxidoreductase subunit M
VQWIADLGISYHVGIDGLAVSLMLLTGFLGPVVVLCSWTFIESRVKSFHLALLLIQSAMLGAFASLDVILFYVFFEGMLIPMYFLIGMWGSEKRIQAAMKFFLYTLAGSLLMLVAILAVYFLAQPAGSRSFDYAAFYNSLSGANRELAACVAGKAASCAAMSPLAQDPGRLLARGCSWPSRWPSRSRCRCSRCTPGFRTRTPRRRWRDRSSSPGCC